jgi:hypothetical protein
MVGLVIGAHAASMVSNSTIHRTRPHPCRCQLAQILGAKAARGKSGPDLQRAAMLA